MGSQSIFAFPSPIVKIGKPAKLRAIEKKYWKEVFWSRSYFAASCGGARISILQEYIGQQKTLSLFKEVRNALYPRPEGRGFTARRINSGHVLAHDIRFTLSVTIQRTSKDSAARRRTILLKAETVPAIPPTAVTSRPDFVYPFELSQSEFLQVMDTESYIIAEGLLDYENGFDSRIRQPFCYAYTRGSQTFGRWTGDCGRAQSQIHLAKKLAKP